eukprot:11215287-Alexandrium_andersonii.AAC.1
MVGPTTSPGVLLRGLLWLRPSRAAQRLIGVPPVSLGEPRGARRCGPRNGARRRPAPPGWLRPCVRS